MSESSFVCNTGLGIVSLVLKDEQKFFLFSEIREVLLQDQNPQDEGALFYIFQIQLKDIFVSPPTQKKDYQPVAEKEKTITAIFKAAYSTCEAYDWPGVKGICIFFKSIYSTRTILFTTGQKLRGFESSSSKQSIFRDAYDSLTYNLS